MNEFQREIFLDAYRTVRAEIYKTGDEELTAIYKVEGVECERISYPTGDLYKAEQQINEHLRACVTAYGVDQKPAPPKGE